MYHLEEKKKRKKCHLTQGTHRGKLPHSCLCFLLQNQLPGGHLPHAGVADVELHHLPVEKAAGEEQHQQEDALAQQEEAR